jgi:hypothetical protein
MLLNTSNLVIIFFAVIGGFIVLLFGLKFIYRFRFHKKYNIFPRINNEGISNTAMVIAICVSIILLLTFLSAGVLGIFFRIYPG